MKLEANTEWYMQGLDAIFQFRRGSCVKHSHRSDKSVAQMKTEPCRKTGQSTVSVCLISLQERWESPTDFVSCFPHILQWEVSVCAGHVARNRGVNGAQVTTDGPPELPDHLCKHRGLLKPCSQPDQTVASHDRVKSSSQCIQWKKIWYAGSWGKPCFREQSFLENLLRGQKRRAGLELSSPAKAE